MQTAPVLTPVETVTCENVLLDLIDGEKTWTPSHVSKSDAHIKDRR